MRHVYFCTALGVVAMLGSASFAAQSYVSPDLRYTSFPDTQVADIGAADDTGIIKCAYDSPGAYVGCSTNSDCSGCESDCESGCEGCASCCGIGDWRERADSSGWIAGYEFLWLKPHFSSGLNFESEVDQGAINTEQQFGFRTDYDLAPRVWFGYQWCSGFAARLRYWQFDQGLGSNAFAATSENIYWAPSELNIDGFYIDEPGEFLAVQNGIKADVIDLDLTQDFNWCHTRLTLGGGISYAGLRMDRRLASITIDDQDRTVIEAEERTIRFEGIGPTVLAELKRQVRCSCISLVGSVRGTALFGRQRTLVRFVSVTEGYPPWVQTSSLSTNRTRAIFAATIGVQYDREICCGTDLFARLSWEGQYWNDFGSPVRNDGDLAFQGLGIAFGLRR